MSNRTETPAPSMPERLQATRVHDNGACAYVDAGPGGFIDEAVVVYSGGGGIGSAVALAHELVRRWNSHAALVAACERCIESLDCALPDDAMDIGAALAKSLRGIDAAHEALRSALAAARKEGGA